MKENKKVTIKELIAQKESFDKRKNQTRELYVASLEGTVTIRKPSRELCLDALEMDKTGDQYLVYNCIVEPNLKSEELQKEFGCVTPMEIIEKIFEPGEVASIAKACVELAGYGDSVKVVDEIKN